MSGLRGTLATLSIDEIGELADLVLAITEPQNDGEELSRRYILTCINDWIKECRE